MKKDDFLMSIKQAANIFPRIQKLWEIAVKVDSSDTRWHDVENHCDQAQRLNSFCRAFGVEIPKAQQKKRVSQREIKRLEMQLARMRNALEKSIKNGKTRGAESYKVQVASLEAELAEARAGEGRG